MVKGMILRQTFFRAATLVLAVSIASCSTTRHDGPPGYPALSIVASCPTGAEPRYSDTSGSFPGERGPAEGSYYHTLLKELSQRPLACSPESAVAYRLVRTAVVDSLEVVLKLERVGDQISGLGIVRNRETKSIVKRTETRLTEQQWDSVARAIGEYNFWQQPTKERPVPQSTRVLDGGLMTIEGYTLQRYHVVIRDLPDERSGHLADVFFQTLNVGLGELRDAGQPTK